MPSTTDPSAWAPSVESPPGETLAPAGLTTDLEQAVSLFWGSYSNFSPTGECSRNARETASHCPPGEKDRKRLRSDCSSSKEEETKTSRKDSDDAIRASEDEIQDLLVSENGGNASAQTPHDNANAFKRVDCNL